MASSAETPAIPQTERPIVTSTSFPLFHSEDYPTKQIAKTAYRQRIEDIATKSASATAGSDLQFWLDAVVEEDDPSQGDRLAFLSRPKFDDNILRIGVFWAIHQLEQEQKAWEAAVETAKSLPDIEISRYAIPHGIDMELLEKEENLQMKPDTAREMILEFLKEIHEVRGQCGALEQAIKIEELGPAVLEP